MARAKAEITISHIIDIKNVTRYYLLQSSTLTTPIKPTTYPPDSSWKLTEPSYTTESTNTLYFVDCTVFTNDTFKYSDVSKSSSYEAAKAAYNKATNAQNTADSANQYVTNAKNNYGYQYKYTLTINGDSTSLYYPVILRGGDQNVMRELMVTRAYSDKAPSDWNGHPSSKGISLLLKIKCNYGGWGGVNYSWNIHDLEECYGNVFAGATHCMSNMGFALFLRGGGTTGALYHLYSDQPLEVTQTNGNSPQICYKEEKIGWSGGTEAEPSYLWLAPPPRSLTDSVQKEIASKKYIDVASSALSKVIAAETQISQNKNAIELRATKTEVANIQVGGRNYIIPSELSSYSNYNSNPVYDGNYTVTSTLTNNATVYFTLQVNNFKPLDAQYTVSGYIKVNDVIPKTSYFTQCASTYGNNCIKNKYNPSTGYFEITQDYPVDSQWIFHCPINRTTKLTDKIQLTKLKFELGNKATDWTPAPEDLASSNGLEAAENAAQDAADKLAERIEQAESRISQIADSISTMVVDGSGASLMEQTSSGWIFSMGETLTQLQNAIDGIKSLENDIDAQGGDITALENAVTGLEKLTSYIRITTDGDEPCIELGNESSFKVLITNTAIKFMDGTTVPAYVTNQSLKIGKAEVEDELAFGGFAFAERSNGNMGLIWKGSDS